MRKTRIYSSDKLTTGQAAILTGSPARHIAQVLRMSVGDKVILFDGSGDEFAATITQLAKGRVEVRVDAATTPATESSATISLWHGLCRSGKMDSIVQKATELGVAEIQPIICEHGIIKLDDQRAAKKTAHWKSVAAGACEQSGRVKIPVVQPPARLVECLTKQQDTIAACNALMFDPAGQASLDSQLDKSRDTLLLTGPEGGFSASEKQAAEAAGFDLVSLGPRILRTETAPIVALGLVQSRIGDLGN